MISLFLFGIVIGIFLLYAYFLEIFKAIVRVFTYSRNWYQETFRSYHFKTKNSLSRQVDRQQTLSLTSSPLRISQDISPTFDSFRESQLKQILLHLPRHFRNDPKEVYNADDLKKLQSKLPKLRIVWHDVDTGPDMKLTGNFKKELVEEGILNQDDYLVILDDDTLYHNTWIDSLDETWASYAKADHDRLIISGEPSLCQGIPVAPGCLSFSLRFGSIDTQEFVRKNAMYRESSYWCQRHDDWTMGATFQDLSQTIVQVRNAHGILQTSRGFGDDALHLQQSNFIKNYECAASIWNLREMCPLQGYNLWYKYATPIMKFMLRVNH